MKGVVPASYGPGVSIIVIEYFCSKGARYCLCDKYTT